MTYGVSHVGDQPEFGVPSDNDDRTGSVSGSRRSSRHDGASGSGYHVNVPDLLLTVVVAERRIEADMLEDEEDAVESVSGGPQRPGSSESPSPRKKRRKTKSVDQLGASDATGGTSARKGKGKAAASKATKRGKGKGKTKTTGGTGDVGSHDNSGTFVALCRDDPLIKLVSVQRRERDAP